MSGLRDDAARRRVGHFSLITASASLLALVVGALALLGWLLGVESLKAVVPGHVAMKANAAVSLIALGAALRCLRCAGRSRLRLAAWAAVALVGALRAGDVEPVRPRP